MNDGSSLKVIDVRLCRSLKVVDIKELERVVREVNWDTEQKRNKQRNTQQKWVAEHHEIRKKCTRP